MLSEKLVSPRDLIVAAFDALEPRDALDVADHALAHRKLFNEGGGHVGNWTHDLTPYLIEPMRELTSLDFMTEVIVGPGQSAKTTVAENWLQRSIESDQGNFLWYMQTDQGVESYVKSRINPMIDGHDGMRRRLGPRPADDSLHYKRFAGMTVEFLAAAPSTLINKSAPRIVVDEIDAYARNLGNVKGLVDIRRQTFGRESMVLGISHPDQARGLNPDKDWTDGIMAWYADSDRRVWWWACPHCAAYSSPCPIASRVMTLDYPTEGTLDEIEQAAHMKCPICGALISDRERLTMNASGKWVGLGQEIAQDGTVTGERVKRATAGFWIVGLMSPFLFGGLGGLARALVKAEREAELTGDDDGLREVVVKHQGIPFAPKRAKVGTISANDLAERAVETLKLKRVPAFVRFLTAFADVQSGRFELLVRGWGERGESVVVDHQKIAAEPEISPEDWDKLFAIVAAARYELDDGSGRTMSIRGFGYDSGGLAGTTQQAYDAFTRHRRRNAVTFFGKIDGRDVYSAMPFKGAATPNAPRLQVVYPDTARKDRKVSRTGAVPLGQFNPNHFKDDLAGQLARADAGPWHVHFPAALRAKEAPHPFFEQMVAERRNAAGRWEKAHQGIRNEALDLMVGTHVVAHLHGLARINWDRPPPWCAPWDANVCVHPPGATEAAPLPPAPGQKPVAPAAVVVAAAHAKRSIADMLA